MLQSALFGQIRRGAGRRYPTGLPDCYLHDCSPIHPAALAAERLHNPVCMLRLGADLVLEVYLFGLAKMDGSCLVLFGIGFLFKRLCYLELDQLYLFGHL